MSPLRNEEINGDTETFAFTEMNHGTAEVLYSYIITIISILFKDEHLN